MGRGMVIFPWRRKSEYLESMDVGCYISKGEGGYVVQGLVSILRTVDFS